MVFEEKERKEMSEWQTKVWGKTRCLVDTPFYSKHELELEAGGFCSCHMHNQRMNKFIVKSGVVRIVWVFAWKIHSIDMTEGMYLEIASLVPHQFQILASGKMTEEYAPDRNGIVKISDIIRLTKGNKIEDLEHMRDTVGILKYDGTFWEENAP